MLADQLTGLRQLARSQGTPRARIICVTSGKGGVGKTNLAINLGIGLAREQKQVVLMDLDLGLANVDVILNLNTRYNLSHFIHREVGIEDLLVPTSHGVRVIVGASGIEDLANLAEGDRDYLLSELESLYYSADFILLDTGAGISKNVLSFAVASDEVLLVTTPEPTAIVDAYAMLKLIARYRRTQNFYVVVNMVSRAREADHVSSGFCSIARQFLNVYVEPLGYVVSDPSMARSVVQKKPLLASFPHTPAASNIQAMAGKLAKNFYNTSLPEEGGFFRRVFHSLFGSPSR